MELAEFYAKKSHKANFHHGGTETRRKTDGGR